MMGSLSDSWRSRLGRRHPFNTFLPYRWVLASSFFYPLVNSEYALFGWLLIFSIPTRLALTLYSVPHMALGGELTTDALEWMSLVAVRLVFNIVGMIAVYGLGLGFFFAASEAYPNGQLNAAAYPGFAGWFAFEIVVLVPGSTWGVHHVIPRLSVPDESQRQTTKQLFQEVIGALRNRSFRWLLIGWVVISAPIGVGASLALYLNTFLASLAGKNGTCSRLDASGDGYRLYVRTRLESVFREKADALVGRLWLDNIFHRTGLFALGGALPGVRHQFGCRGLKHL
jgi:GPH family glycoside/pentoside/hexuronide:cation symporter